MITTAEVVEFLPSQNMDEAIINSQIRTVKEVYLEKMLGVVFYTQLDDQYNSDTLTAANELLLEKYLKPILANYIIYRCLPHIKTEISSNGLNVLVPEYANPSAQKDFDTLRNQVLSTAEHYVERAIDYIKCNQASYPLYSCMETINKTAQPYLYNTFKNKY